MRLTSNIHDTALIFEGGGMRGSYTAAVVSTLLAAGLHFDFVAGISAGSSHTVNYLSRDPGRARETFVDFAADPRMGDLWTFLRGKGLFNAQYIYEETGLPDQALPFDWNTFQANPARCRIGAVRCDDGQPVYWGKEDMPSLRDLGVRVRASSTMPVIMPITSIEGTDYVDGALGPSGGIPLEAAEAEGFSRFLVVLTQERSYVKPPQRRASFFRRYFRNYPAVADAILQRHQNYNQTRERIMELERQGRALVFAPKQMPVGNGERSVVKLQASYELGLAQAQRELPRWREFLGADVRPDRDE